MQRIRSRLAYVAALGLLTAAPLSAQVEFAPFVGGAVAATNLTEEFSFGGVSFENQHLETSVVLGAHVGARVAPSFSLEGTLMLSPSVITAPSTELSPGNTETGLYNSTTVLTYGVNAVLNFPGEGFVEPFLTAGIGARTIRGEDPFGGFDSPTMVAYNAGAGLRWRIHPSYAIRFDLRDYISEFLPNELNNDETSFMQHDVMITIGVSFSGS